MANILIIGATSAIVGATARLYAARGERLHLVGRNHDRLKAMQKDLEIRGAAGVAVSPIDLDDPAGHEPLLDEIFAALGTVDQVLIGHGIMPEQAACEADMATTLQVWQSNVISPISLLTLLANRLEEQGHGTIGVIGSVAGDRGRAANYVYGASKAALAAFATGMAARLAKSGVDLVLIKPGFVDTPMTAAFKKGLLWARPQSVARDIVGAMDKGKRTIYTPWFWRWIMAILMLLPEPLFRRLGI